MPYPDTNFDVLVSNMTVHNLPDTAGCACTFAEIVRMLKPGGRLSLLNFRCAGDRARVLRIGGMLAVRRSWPSLWMFPPVSIMRAQKP